MRTDCLQWERGQLGVCAVGGSQPWGVSAGRDEGLLGLGFG